MHSLILATATRFLMGLLLLFSIFLMLRGHNEPGGGFAGGLVAAAAFALYTISFDLTMARRALRFDPRSLSAVGLLISAISGIIPLFFNKPFLTGIWCTQKVPIIGKIGTPFLFDTGVYFVVLGVTLTIIFALTED
ncbi:Na+/H+ antiporter subunit B [candidate division KSB1 bacterium]|nr:Na+/H+ antiporter subunit B [candidate division KSB1 bacterium]